jgi:pimeloyl-ACP methyl ester carboxylesterase
MFARRDTPTPAARPLTVLTSDGVGLQGLHLPGAVGAPVFVIGHGFTNSIAKASTRAVIDHFADFGAVVALDFRGHGRSGGSGSVGRDEVLDLDAAVAFASSQDYGAIHSVGFSMGASIALRHAALGARSVDTVVAVSSPSRWYIRETSPMRRVHWLLENPLGPAVGRMLGVRLGVPWPVIPQTPLEVIDRITPTPLLLVHGTDDHYFSPAHALALQAASRGHAELWIEPGMGHAESASTPELIGRIAQWSIGPRPDRASVGNSQRPVSSHSG